MSEQTMNNLDPNPGRIEDCPSCKRVFQVPLNWQAIVCPACQQAHLQPSQQASHMPPIELIVPPKLDHNAIRLNLQAFCKGAAFPVPDLNPETLAQRMLLINWPVWLTDSDLSGEWDATFGYDYEVESSREQMGGGSWSSQKVIKTRVKDEPRKGFIERHYDNVLSPALHSHEERLSQLGPYDLGAAYVSQSQSALEGLSQIGTIMPDNLEDSVKRQFSSLAAHDCQKASGAQHLKSFTFYGEFKNMHWSHAMLPMLSTYYEDDDGVRYVVGMNAQTGVSYGPRIASIKKAWLLTGILLAVSIVLMLILYLTKQNIFICASILIILSFIPLVRAASWNKKEKAKRPLA